MTIRATLLVAALALGGCQGFGDIWACEQEAQALMDSVVVQDQVCTTGPGLLGGLVTTCSASPRRMLIHNTHSEQHRDRCIAVRRAQRGEWR